MRGVVTFVFDDGYERVYQNAVPLLRQHKFPAVFALPLEGRKLAKTEQRKIKPWPEWVSIKSEGHELASHSVTHPDLTKCADEALARELAEPARILGSKTLVYPGGSFDDRVVETARQYYTAGRGVKRGFETIPPRDPMRLKSINWSRRNWRVWKANLFALWAWLTNRWLIETFHMIDGDDEPMVHTVKTADLARHMALVAKLPVRVQTIRAVMEKI